ncbi:PREDICTED: uncharacterized protein LOC108614317 isoform X2 [Drosophila arizonae]|uniref:Uncharacterized protein LOC108614317 isoform X2 n=1 Tax=Drosophila arizonae TaxID=7263 RepID=A0ABM1P9J3_DROAR|nr:PREDICTED: uncharacterized protein LOC108614317 isoform X2 [Drosophila arizonae]
MALRVRYKWSDLTDEQLLELFESVPSDVDISSISSDNEDEEDEDLAEALNTAIEDASTVSLKLLKGLDLHCQLLKEQHIQLYHLLVALMGLVSKSLL